ncbi:MULTISPECIES: hypothetical protein [unclassified Methylobacterium]|uniref:hypothetical protein n=1 Tax=unclassified Methylobacterium TaxID=2615210 RepID=UPI0013538AF8|nr:hypothetical protein [Methylobacterium sp. 2A]MWV24748.1 hypothetical protein [Methylobacterium sp. 2A]
MSDPAVLKELEGVIGEAGVEDWRHSCMVLRAAEAAIRLPYLEDEYRSFPRFAEHYAFLKRLDLRLGVDSKLVDSISGVIQVCSLEGVPSELPAHKDEVLTEVEFSAEELGSWAMKRYFTHTPLFTATTNDPADIRVALEAYAETLFFEFLAQTFNAMLDEDAAGAA